MKWRLCNYAGSPLFSGGYMTDRFTYYGWGICYSCLCKTLEAVDFRGEVEFVRFDVAKRKCAYCNKVEQIVYQFTTKSRVSERNIPSVL